MTKTRTEELKGKINIQIGSAIVVGSEKTVTTERRQQIIQDSSTQILKACQEAGLVFKVKDAKVPQRTSYKKTVLNAHNSESEIYLQGQLDAQADILKAHWEKTEEIELRK